MSQQPEKQPPLTRQSADPGEEMDVRRVHAAIWREEAEPSEAFQRTPALLMHFYFLSFLGMIVYVLSAFPPLDWNEYESSPIQRLLRAHVRPAPTSPQLPR